MVLIEYLCTSLTSYCLSPHPQRTANVKLLTYYFSTSSAYFTSHSRYSRCLCCLSWKHPECKTNGNQRSNSKEPQNTGLQLSWHFSQHSNKGHHNIACN